MKSLRSLHISVCGVAGKGVTLVIPDAIDTVAEFSRYISTAIPVRTSPNENTKPFRFFYSSLGEPLWSVSDCLAAGAIYVSVHAGFVPIHADQIASEEKTPVLKDFSSPFSSAGSKQRAGGESASPAPCTPKIQQPLQHHTDNTITTMTVSSLVKSAGSPPTSYRRVERPKTVFPPLNESLAAKRFNCHICERLMARKWSCYRKVRYNENLIGEEEIAKRVEGVLHFRKDNNEGEAPFRVLVSGPPGSGVSTVTAMVAQKLLTHCGPETSAPRELNPFYGSLVVPLDVRLLLEQGEIDENGRGRTDLLFWCEVVLYTIIDAAAAGWHGDGVLLSSATVTEYWMSLICSSSSPASLTRLRNELVNIVGESIVSQWEAMAQRALPFFKARNGGLSSAQTEAIRDDALEFIFRDLAVVIGASLGYAGVFFILDGAEMLCQCGIRPTRLRPLGDLTPVLKAFFDLPRTPRIHALIAFSEDPQPLTYTPGLTVWIKTIHLVNSWTNERGSLPEHIHCFSETFPIDIFLGAPGYLAGVQQLLMAVIDQGIRSIPSCIQIDFKAVQQELRSLAAVDRRVGST